MNKSSREYSTNSQRERGRNVFFDEINSFTFLGKSKPVRLNNCENDSTNINSNNKKETKHNGNNKKLIKSQSMKEINSKEITKEALWFINSKKEEIQNKTIDFDVENNDNFNERNFQFEFNDSFGDSNKNKQKSHIDKYVKYVFEVLGVDKCISKFNKISFDKLISISEHSLAAMNLEMVEKNRIRFFIKEYNIFTHKINHSFKPYTSSTFDKINFFLANNKKFLFTKQHIEEIEKYKMKIPQNTKIKQKNEIIVSHSSLSLKGTHTHKINTNIKEHTKALLLYKRYQELNSQIDQYFNQSKMKHKNKTISKVSSSLSTALNSTQKSYII